MNQLVKVISRLLAVLIAKEVITKEEAMFILEAAKEGDESDRA